MGAVVVGLRAGDHKHLTELAAQRGLPVKDVAGILLEEAIRREAGTLPPSIRTDGTRAADPVR
jgi:hypothetical protein